MTGTRGGDDNVGPTDEIRAFPRGSRVVHIGPPKTGTTAVQSSLFRRRAELAAYGVAYPGRRRHERAAVSSVAFDEIPAGYPADIARHWQRFTGEIRESTADRVVVSSETLSHAPDSRLEQIVDDLGSGLQIVITMRPLAAMLPSRWQQSVQSFQVASYEEWLRRLFSPDADTDPHTGPLWRRFRVDRLIERWGARVGEENVTLIVLDPGDRSMLLGTFEQLLGLPEGFLVPAPDQHNVSLPYPEVEMLRAFNRRFRAEGLGRALFVRSVRTHGLQQIKAAGQAIMEPYPIDTPTWAVEEANAVAAEMIDGVRASGARVIGDLSHLLMPVPAEDPRGVPTSVAVDSAAEIAYAMFLAGRTHALGGRKRAPRRPSVEDVAGRDLARALLRRVAHRMRPGRGPS